MPATSTSAGSYSMNTESLRALQSSLAESVAAIESELGSLSERLDALSGEWTARLSPPTSVHSSSGVPRCSG